MNKHDVQIITLPPMRIASVYGFGEQPELQAWDKLITYAQPKGFLDDPASHRIFGFNNPDPSHGSPNYGYELWIQVGVDAEPENEVRIEDFGGGLYAVMHCDVKEGNFDLIGETWKALVAWREDSRYEHGKHQWLEEAISFDRMEHGEITLDLLLPLSE
jgi:DNA gyrase inhibitor GyrI